MICNEVPKIFRAIASAPIITIIANLQLKMGCELLEPAQLERLSETAHLIDELLNRSPDPSQPYVGKHAFAHKAGLHAAGARTDSRTFEHVEPRVIGNSSDVLVSELSGRAAIVEKLAREKKAPVTIEKRLFALGRAIAQTMEP